MDTILENIRQEKDVRANLIALRQLLKESGEKEKVANFFKDTPELFWGLLFHEDPKVRKNSALLIGDIQAQEMTEILYQAYEKEETLFVRKDYLKAMGQLNIEHYQEKLSAHLEQMKAMEIPEESQKHYREEMAALQKLVLQKKTGKRLTFAGADKEYDVILTTNRNYREITARQVIGKKVSLVPLGVKVQKADLRQLWQIRTFKEVLFTLDVQTVGPKPEDVAKDLAKSDLMTVLKKAYGNVTEFYFRITIAGRMPLDKRSNFIKKCSFELERSTGHNMVNTASNYDVEIRLLERKDGTFLPVVKLHSLKDMRFSYRKEVISTSIHPSEAALLAMLVKPYLKERAQVLDPFCGVGTMLIERDALVEAGPMYGIDIFGEAIHKARENTKIAHKEIYYINRDFFDFSHDYLFDEIFTNMPVRGKKTREEHELFYQEFFEKALKVLKADGIIILYSNEKGFIKKQLRLNKQLKLLNEFSINEKEEFSIYVLGRRD